MDMNRLLQLLWRQFGGKLLNFAMKKGIDHLDRRPPASAGAAQQKQSARQLARQAQQIRNLTRRLF